jgi:hypothetical protein
MKRMTTVSDSLLQEVTRRLVEQFQPEQIILFGQRTGVVGYSYLSLPTGCGESGQGLFGFL